MIVSETSYETETVTKIQTQTITVPAPSNTRLAAFPTPDVVSSMSTTPIPRTTAIDIITEDEEFDPSLEDEDTRTVTVVRGPRSTRRPPAKWFGGW